MMMVDLFETGHYLKAIHTLISVHTLSLSLSLSDKTKWMEKGKASPQHQSSIGFPLCKTRRDTLASDPKARQSRRASSSQFTSSARSSKVTTFPTNTTSISSSSLSTSSLSSIAGLRDSLRETPILFSFDEISSATDSFHSPRLSPNSSNPSWRCSLRGHDTAVFRCRFHGDPALLPARLAAACRTHHASVARLLGAALAGEGCIYLVYKYVPGASLANCLRNCINPGYTSLSSWVSRMQVASDLAQGLEYIHHYSSTGSIHNRIKSSGIVITELGLRAKLCHFAATELTGNVSTATEQEMDQVKESRCVRIEGTRGYMAPEVIAGGRVSQKSDVFALGVVLLELVSGKEPLQDKYNKESRQWEVASLVKTARKVIVLEDEEMEAEERRGRVRRWVDARLRDSFPVDVSERVIRLALRCVDADAGARPDMMWVAGKVSRLLLESKAWEDKLKTPTGLSVSIAPR